MIPVSAVIIIALIAIAWIIAGSINKVLKNATHQLQQSASDIVYAAANLSRTSANIAESGNEQEAAIEKTSATMNQTSAMVDQTTDNTHQAQLLTRETYDETAEGARKVTKLINFMDELAASSHDIAKVINTISGIASQTNILALNASVESARAGDAGKAFAVVSEEVRDLAQKCNDAVKTTSAIIENNARLTELSISNSHEVETAFGNISNKVQKVNQIVEEITTASDEQAKDVKSVNDTLTEMEKNVHANVASAAESEAAANVLQMQADILQQLTDNINTLVGDKGSKNGQNGQNRQNNRTGQKNDGYSDFTGSQRTAIDF
jgi:methyl-accepting chemotaxis protein